MIEDKIGFEPCDEFGKDSKNPSPIISKKVSLDESSFELPALNLPESDLPENMVTKDATSCVSDIKKELKNACKSFVRIGYSLYMAREKKYYKELGYKTMDEFVKTEFAISKGTAYTFMSVACKYTQLDEEGKPSLVLKNEFQNFSSSQLVAMLKMDEETMNKVKPTDTIKEINKLKKNANFSEEIDVDDLSENVDEVKSKPKTVKQQDIKTAVGRTFVGTALKFEGLKEYKDFCEKYLSDEKKQNSGLNYRLELNVIWDLPVDESVE